ncbi:MAG TPA: hypothetical protein PKI60_00875 [Oscillospiraceae bacterium]|nr:hypothetical protein [Oscillospiraceae bacterium]
MRRKKERHVFAAAFFTTLIAFSFFYFLLTAYVNTRNIANKDKIYMLDLQRTGADTAVFSFIGEDFEYPIPEEKGIPAAVYIALPDGVKLMSAAIGLLGEKILDEENDENE